MEKMADDADFDFYARVAALGAVAGLRSLTAPALLSYFAARGEAGKLKNGLTGSPKIAVALGALAIGELVGDKLPFAPLNRAVRCGSV